VDLHTINRCSKEPPATHAGMNCMLPIIPCGRWIHHVRYLWSCL